MDIKIITEGLHLSIYGFGAIADGKDYTATAFKLSGKMWDVVKANGMVNKGKNIWVYENGDRVFAGVELDKPNENTNLHDLEHKTTYIQKYGYFMHIGPYNQIKKSGENMAAELTRLGHTVIFPYIEIYGHWSADETKQETELIMCLK